MNDIKAPKLVEFFNTKTLSKGRVETSLRLFMLDYDVFNSICLAYIRGETTTLECRTGVTVKSPKDKYSKAIAKQEVYKKLRKEHLVITEVSSTKGRTIIHTDSDIYVVCNSAGNIYVCKYDRPDL